MRVDPLGEIAEADELNDIATQDSVVAKGGASQNASSQLRIVKAQTPPAGGAPVATNATPATTSTSRTTAPTPGETPFRPRW